MCRLRSRVFSRSVFSCDAAFPVRRADKAPAKLSRLFSLLSFGFLADIAHSMMDEMFSRVIFSYFSRLLAFFLSPFQTRFYRPAIKIPSLFHAVPLFVLTQVERKTFTLNFMPKSCARAFSRFGSAIIFPGFFNVNDPTRALYNSPSAGSPPSRALIHVIFPHFVPLFHESSSRNNRSRGHE